MDIYEQYALLKAQEASIGDKIDAMKVKIIEDMKKRNKTKDENSWGKFSIASKKTYTYSKKVVKLEEEVKILKNTEVEKGIAKAKETNYLLYKVNE